jgi:hypothetical protein
MFILLEFSSPSSIIFIGSHSLPLSCHQFGPSWFPRGGSRGGSFGRRDALDCANPTMEQMTRHLFYSFDTNLVLSCLFTHMLTFEFQVGDLRNVWLIDSGCSRHMTRDKGWFSSLVSVVSKTFITFGDNG